MENNENKVEKPSVEELTRFYTIEQAKQELESFAKEKGSNFKFYTCDDDEYEIPSRYIEGVLEIGERCRRVGFDLNVIFAVAGCFKQQLDRMKMIVERLSHTEIPFYDNCRDIYFNAKDNSLSMSYYQPNMPDCIRLKIEFVMNGCEPDMFLSAYKIYPHLHATEDIASVLYSRDGTLTLLKHAFIPDFEDIENSYMFWRTRERDPNHDEMKNHRKPDPRALAIFQPDNNYDDSIQQNIPNFLIKICRSTLPSGSHTDFAVTAALAEVLELEGVEILDSYSFPNSDACYYRWPDPILAIIIAVSFTVNGRKFVFHRNINFREFYIDEIGAGNRLVLMESFTNTNVGKIRSAICRFLGIQL